MLHFLEGRVSLWIILNSCAWKIGLFSPIYSTLFFILMLNLFQLWLLGALSVGLPSVSFDMPLLCSLFLFNNSLSSVTIRFSKLILYIPCSSPRITYFSEEPTFLLLKNGIRNRSEIRFNYCSWGITAFTGHFCLSHRLSFA